MRVLKRKLKSKLKNAVNPHGDIYKLRLKEKREKDALRRKLEEFRRAEEAEKELPLHLQSKDSYKLKRAMERAKERSAAVLRMNLIKQAKEKARLAMLRKKREKERLARERLARKKAAEEAAKLALAIKIRRALDLIEDRKQGIAKAILEKEATAKLALARYKREKKRAKRKNKKRSKKARKILAAMKDRQEVDRMKAELAKLSAHAAHLQGKIAALRDGANAITTKNVIEDGLGDGRLEDGFVRNVLRPDPQAQKVFDEMKDAVAGDLKNAGDTRQRILDEAKEHLPRAHRMRLEFQDFKIEHKKTMATPKNWPEAVFEATEVQGEQD